MSRYSVFSLLDADRRYKRQRDRNRAIINEFKMSRGCERCGFREHPIALELDHKDHRKKAFPISGSTVSVARLLREIKKCRVLCANCHRILHYEAGWITWKKKL